MADPQTLRGGCHCGKVRYTVTTALDSVIAGNCSICATKGLVLTFVPATQFELTSGADALTEYRFNKKVIAHQFCSTCGVESFARGAMPDGTQMAAINVRCLEGVDVEKLDVTPYDCKHS